MVVVVGESVVPYHTNDGILVTTTLRLKLFLVFKQRCGGRVSNVRVLVRVLVKAARHRHRHAFCPTSPRRLTS